MLIIAEKWVRICKVIWRTDAKLKEEYASLLELHNQARENTVFFNLQIMFCELTPVVHLSSALSFVHHLCSNFPACVLQGSQVVETVSGLYL